MSIFNKSRCLEKWIKHLIVLRDVGMTPQFLLRLIDPFHKSQNASDKYPTVHQFVAEMCAHVHISVTKLCILGNDWCIVGFVRHVFSQGTQESACLTQLYMISYNGLTWQEHPCLFSDNYIWFLIMAWHDKSIHVCSHTIIYDFLWWLDMTRASMFVHRRHLPANSW